MTPKLVLVVWVDSCGAESGWEDIDNFSHAQIMKCKSVGWLVHEDSERLVLVPHVALKDDGEFLQGCGDMVIPKMAVVGVEDLETRPK